MLHYLTCMCGRVFWDLPLYATRSGQPRNVVLDKEVPPRADVVISAVTLLLISLLTVVRVFTALGNRSIPLVFITIL
jgi:hypothetical protein